MEYDFAEHAWEQAFCTQNLINGIMDEMIHDIHPSTHL